MDSAAAHSPADQIRFLLHDVSGSFSLPPSLLACSLRVYIFMDNFINSYFYTTVYLECIYFCISLLVNVLCISNRIKLNQGFVLKCNQHAYFPSNEQKSFLCFTEPSLGSGMILPRRARRKKETVLGYRIGCPRGRVVCDDTVIALVLFSVPDLKTARRIALHDGIINI